MLSVSIIGVGKMGCALALALDSAGFSIKNLVSKTSKNRISKLPLANSNPNYLTEIQTLDTDLILITTQDSEIEFVAGQISQANRENQFVFHTSGSLSSAVLAKLPEKGYEIGSIHPLVSVSDPIIGAKRFEGAFFCIEGTANSIAIAENLVKTLGGKPFSIESKYKTLYHASAVTACGHFVALFSVAIEMLSKCGLNEKEAKEILLPLLKSTVDNLSVQPNETALTGTFARLDEEILQNQIYAIGKNMPQSVFEIFLLLGLQSLKLNQDTSAERLAKIENMTKMISIAKNHSE